MTDIVYTIEKNLYSRNTIIDHHVLRQQGNVGERTFECDSKVTNHPYYLYESKRAIYLSKEAAEKALNKI